MTGFGYNINGFGAGGALPPYNADFLVVAGGGGGAHGTTYGRAGGGGGGGGFRTFTCQELTAGANYSVTVGAGGSGTCGFTGDTRGGNSSIVGTGVCVVSAGGGRGGSAYEQHPTADGGGPSLVDDCMPGGSGGGGGGSNAGARIPHGGTGNTPPVSPSQGNNGGRGGGADCFIAGTQVMMHDQSFKNIEDVQVGDRVYRFDGESNTVLELKNNITTNGRKLVSINGGEYFFTEDHPLKTPDGWKSVNSEMSNDKYNIGDIDQLQIGDTIIGLEANYTVIKTIDTKEVPDNTPIYNFELDGDHEYFANGFLVHNKGGGGGGGGGAGGAGGNGAGNSSGGSGGAAAQNAYSTGTNIGYATGGNGGQYSGASPGQSAAQYGSSNQGGGGNGGQAGSGGSQGGQGGAGDAGFVVIRYDTSQAGSAGASGGNATATYTASCTPFKVHRFTSSGCYTA